MTKPLSDIARNLVVCVVTALSKGQIREQFVFVSLPEADRVFKKLCIEYGKTNVVRASKSII
jgi:hypothetical protein